MFYTIRWSVWGQQIWALVGAVAALTTMAILLGKFNNRPVFNQMGVTLNAIISVLSVAVKAAVAFVLSECMAQWKWILYAREDRLMIDFDRLDGAARGPLGSLRVLSRTKGASIAQFGAVLTIVALALDPFAQQLLRLREAIVLEFHKLWSVVTKNPLEIVKASKEDDWQMQSSRNQVTIQSESVKSISAYIQTLFRWEPWFNDTKVRAQLSRLEGMENAVGFNGASFGPVTSLYAAAQPPALNRLVSLSRSDFAGVSAVFESMAMSMTNEIRRTHEDADVARNGMNTMTYEGLVGSTVVLYEVKWQWIALHVTVLTLACTLMLMTIINTRSNVDVPLWKSSSLAALRRGNDIGGLLKDSGKSVADMEDAARKMYMSGRRIDVEETKYQGKQYSNLVESERAWQIDLSEGLAETSTTDTVEERFEPPSPASFHDQGLEMAPRTYSHTF
ncbi:hypothetical protein COL154_010795 [Colletotrichum chrysophilum]|nr:hypothetical protein KNSL1_006292 [Colletotrichum chrysophilum]KAJ0356774.1 hypothetical protein COL154_010795 [Colletotrichum chrysophilum]